MLPKILHAIDDKLLQHFLNKNQKKQNKKQTGMSRRDWMQPRALPPIRYLGDPEPMLLLTSRRYDQLKQRS